MTLSCTSPLTENITTGRSYELIVGADQTQGLPAVHPGHVDVQQYEIEGFVTQAFEGLFAGGDGNDVVTIAVEHGAGDVEDLRRVVHDQNAARLCHVPSLGTSAAAAIIMKRPVEKVPRVSFERQSLCETFDGGKPCQS